MAIIPFPMGGGVVTRVIRAIRATDAEIIDLQMAFNPSAFTWASTKGMYAICPEWKAGNYFNQSFDSADVTRGVEWFGNILSATFTLDCINPS